MTKNYNTLKQYRIDQLNKQIKDHSSKPVMFVCKQGSPFTDHTIQEEEEDDDEHNTTSPRGMPLRSHVTRLEKLKSTTESPSRLGALGEC